ncbi:MAG: Flp pilus assembly protein CpaB, partial [Modestobacter sp.]|nr:Flp pilus assembly protein CpaB [Modestobacter sp.]
AGAADVVAAGALVVSAPPGRTPDPPSADREAGLLVLAVPAETAARLAAAATNSTLTVTLGPP